MPVMHYLILGPVIAKPRPGDDTASTWVPWALPPYNPMKRPLGRISRYPSIRLTIDRSKETHVTVDESR